MTYSEIRSYLLEIISDIAPDSDTSDIDDKSSLKNQLDLDSMDFLDLVMELRKRHGVEVPKEDLGQLESLENGIHYLAPKFRKLAA